MQDLPGWLKHTTVWLLLGMDVRGRLRWQQQDGVLRFEPRR